ncbi:hypothetical protein [Caballeronia cordobensis]|uniref:hypothetical protein n=1 Tax=Caballeronia cordobensis TaxID=1353886 RepID=UPI00045EFA22|nr:putative uncharacterized protein [Burkholderia sp. RPE67]
MGRIRTVKPKLFTHEGLFDAEHESGLPLRLAFIGLFTEADREGRFQWRPRTLKAAILPFDDLDFSHVLDALATRGFLVKYASRSGEKLGAIPTFRHHQAINNKETQSELDPPSKDDLDKCASLASQRIPLASSTRRPRVKDASPPTLRNTRGEGKGREGKGKEGKGKNPRAISSRQTTSRARASDGPMTGRDETRESLGDVLDRRGCDPTDEDRATADLAEAEGVSAATLGRAIDDAQRRPSVGRIAAYALRTARAWTAKHAQPLPVIDAGAMPRVVNGSGDEIDSIAKRRQRTRDALTKPTGNRAVVIDVPMTEVCDESRDD